MTSSGFMWGLEKFKTGGEGKVSAGKLFHSLDSEVSTEKRKIVDVLGE